jgi:hypothetical protein
MRGEEGMGRCALRQFAALLWRSWCYGHMDGLAFGTSASYPVVHVKGMLKKRVFRICKSSTRFDALRERDTHIHDS